MIWSTGAGAVRLAAAAGQRAHGNLERALPGEWVALVLTLVAIAVLGAGILLATRVEHGRVVARRRARQSARRGTSRMVA
jgi:heme exporter protein D